MHARSRGMWRKGEEEIPLITRLTPEVPPMERHAVDLHETKKILNGLRQILTWNNKYKEKLRQWVTVIGNKQENWRFPRNTLSLCKSCNIKIPKAGYRLLIKVTQIITQVVMLRLLLVTGQLGQYYQHKQNLHILCGSLVMMARPDICTKEKDNTYGAQTNCCHQNASTGAYMINVKRTNILKICKTGSAI